MPKASARKIVKRTENAILDQAIGQLLCGARGEANKKDKPLNSEQLRKEGFSERFIGKVETACLLHSLRRKL